MNRPKEMEQQQSATTTAGFVRFGDMMRTFQLVANFLMEEGGVGS